MDTNPIRQPAKIYALPARGRAALGGRGYDFERDEHVKPARIAEAEFGNGWYHGAAVQEADLLRKR